jgi:uncharacterized membrane protein (GlpM family)
MELSQLADIFAIPLFALLAYYFYTKEKRTDLENILFLFSVVGLLADIFFTSLYFTKQKITISG